MDPRGQIAGALSTADAQIHLDAGATRCVNEKKLRHPERSEAKSRDPAEIRSTCHGIPRLRLRSARDDTLSENASPPHKRFRVRSGPNAAKCAGRPQMPANARA